MMISTDQAATTATEAGLEIGREYPLVRTMDLGTSIEIIGLFRAITDLDLNIETTRITTKIEIDQDHRAHTPDDGRALDSNLTTADHKTVSAARSKDLGHADPIDPYRASANHKVVITGLTILIIFVKITITGEVTITTPTSQTGLVITKRITRTIKTETITITGLIITITTTQTTTQTTTLLLYLETQILLTLLKFVIKSGQPSNNYATGRRHREESKERSANWVNRSDR